MGERGGSADTKGLNVSQRIEGATAMRESWDGSTGEASTRSRVRVGAGRRAVGRRRVGWAVCERGVVRINAETDRKSDAQHGWGARPGQKARRRSR